MRLIRKTKKTRKGGKGATVSVISDPLESDYNFNNEDEDEDEDIITHSRDDSYLDNTSKKKAVLHSKDDYYLGKNFKPVYKPIEYKPESKEALYDAVRYLKENYQAYKDDKTFNKKKFWDKGLIDNWNVSDIKDMSNLFENFSEFNENISRWDVGNVENASNMFSGCTSFNQDLSVWSIDKIILFNRSDRNRTMFDNAPAMQIDNIPFTFIHYIGLPTKNGGKSKKTRANKKNKRRTQKTRKNKNK